MMSLFEQAKRSKSGKTRRAGKDGLEPECILKTERLSNPGKRRKNPMFSTRLQRAYPSDLTDAQWELLEPLIPPLSPDAAYHLHERRDLVNAILYVLRSGCPWRSLPHDLPAWGTVYHSFRKWQREGVWDRVLETLRMRMRVKEGREAQPSAAVIDSQSIKTSAVRGPEKGVDMGKKNLGAQAAHSGR
jgi:transposase